MMSEAQVNLTGAGHRVTRRTQLHQPPRPQQMPLPQFLGFPVAFRSGLDAAPFRFMSALVLFYVIMPGLASGGEILETSVKYLLAIGLTLCFALIAVTRLRINLSPLFPLAPLLLSVLGGISFAFSIFIAPGTTTASSALIPMIVAGIPLLIDTPATWTDGAAATRYLRTIFGIAALCHVLWQVQARLSGWEEASVHYGEFTVISASSSFVIVFFMILCGLFRQYRLLAVSVTLIAFSELLRPSSTLAFLTMFAAAVIGSSWLGFRRLFRFVCVFAAVTVIIGNLVILESSEVADAIYSVEPAVKEDVGGETNNDFRLGVIAAARDEMAKHSLLVGKFFIGNATVDPSLYLKWLKGAGFEGTLPIHSDFITMIVQGGLIGYGLFAGLFVGLALLCTKGARLAHAARDSSSETLFDALQMMNVIFMLSVSGNPMMANMQQTAPYLILVPLAIFLARAQPGFARMRRRQYATRPIALHRRAS